MPISVACSCGIKLTVPDTAAGKAIACPKCKARMTAPSPALAVAEPLADVLPVATLADASAPSQRQTQRKGLPLWILAVVVPAVGVLLLCCVGGVGFFAYRWGTGPAPVTPQQDGPVAAEKDGNPPTEAQKLYDAYAGNEAAADMQYLGKHVKVVEYYSPQHHKPIRESDGHYKLVFLDHDTFKQAPGYTQPTVVVHLRVSEAEKLARLGDLTEADRLAIHGMCRGLEGELIGRRKYVVLRDATLNVTKHLVFKVKVDANKQWQDAGFDALAGWKVIVSKCQGECRRKDTESSIKSSGMNGVWEGSLNGVERQWVQERFKRLPAPKAPLLCLIGKIGMDGTPAAFTTSRNSSAMQESNSPTPFSNPQPRAGRLFLQANDVDLQENSGSWELEFTLIPP